MGMFKLITGGLVAAVIALFFYQNIPAFNSPVGFQLDLFIHEPVKWEHYLYTLLLIAASLGFLAGFALMLRPYLKLRRLLAAEGREKAPEKESAVVAEAPVVEAVAEKEAESDSAADDR